MSKSLTETATFTTPIVVPEDDIDFTSQASVELPLQALANRTALHQSQLSGLVTVANSNGVYRIRESPSHASLASGGLGTNAGDVVLVPGYGLYRYDPAATDTALLPLIITDTVNGGRWIWQGNTMRGDYNGIASLDGNAVLTLAERPAVNGGFLEQVSFPTHTAAFRTGSTVNELVSNSFTLNVGEKVVFSGNATFTRTSGTQSVVYQVFLVNNGDESSVSLGISLGDFHSDSDVGGLALAGGYVLPSSPGAKRLVVRSSATVTNYTAHSVRMFATRFGV